MDVPFCRILIHVCILLAICIGTAEGENSDIQFTSRGALFLLASPASARMRGMGDAGVALTDEPSGYFNPAALSFMASRWNFGTSNYMGKMELYPELEDGGCFFSTNSFFVDGNKRVSWFGVADETNQPEIRGAIGYHSMEYEFNDEFFGNVARSTERADQVTISTGIRYLVEFGAGMTLKRAKMHYEDGTDGATGKGVTGSFGLLAKIPIIDITEKVTRKTINDGVVRTDINLSAGLLWDNRFGELDWTNGAKELFSRAFRKGIAVSGGVTYRGAVPLNLVTVTISRERSESDYWNQESNKGNELSLLETFTIRDGIVGKYITTNGIRISSDGAMKWFALSMDQGGGRNVMRYIAGHVSIYWDRYKYGAGFDGQKHSQLTILYRM